MGRKKFYKNFVIVIAFVAALSMFIGILSSTIGSWPGKDKSSKSQNNDKYSKVQVKGNNVSGSLDVKDSTNEDDAVKQGEAYAKQLQDKYPGKQVEVAVTNKDGFVTNITENMGLNKSTKTTTDNAIPNYSLIVGKGVMDFDRLVVVTLDTPNPEKYSVSILGYQLKYFPDRKIFQQVIQETDESKIRSDVKVTLNK